MAYKKTGDAGNGGGTAPTNTDDFIFSKVIPFATDMGFVANRAPAPGSAPTREYWTHKGSVGVPAEPYIYIRTRDNAAFFMTGLGIDLAQEIFDQPDNPVNGPSGTGFGDPGSGPLSSNQACPIFKGQASAWAGHHLFSNAAGDYIHAVAQLGAREWRHFHFGKIPATHKYGSWVGGTYVMADWWDKTASVIDVPTASSHWGLANAGGDNAVGRFQKGGFLHCEGLVAAAKWFAGQHSTDTGVTESLSKSVGDVQTTRDMGSFWRLGAHESFSGGLSAIIGASLLARTVPLVPVTLAAKCTFAGNTGWSVLGTIPDVFYINMKEFTPGETLTIGSDSYVVFPSCNSDTVSTVANDPYSGYQGLAYKIIP